jgi:hypothetical protein
MSLGNSGVTIADDGKSISCIEGARTVWTAVSPSLEEWRALGHGSYTEEALRSGVFRWVSAVNDREVVVVFSPRGGLDFNLTYARPMGNLIKIFEAR